MHHIVDLIYDVNSADEMSRAQQLFRRLIKESAEHGAFEAGLRLLDRSLISSVPTQGGASTALTSH